MKRFRDALLARCEHLLKVDPIRPPARPSTADDRSGGELHKARAAQGRVLSLAMGFLLTEKVPYARRALEELWCFADVWDSWVDPYHGDKRYYDLMTGEMCLTAGLAYDWLYNTMTKQDRDRLRKVIIERGLERYLFHTDFQKNKTRAKGWWYNRYHNWNTVCNGGAVVAALALGDEYEPAGKIIRLATKSWVRFFNHLGTEGGWDEGTGYWRYGMRYAVMALEALRSVTGRGEDLFDAPGMRNTGFFPLYFSPGGVAVSFGDAGGLAVDPILYLLAGKYRQPAFVWFQDTYGKIPRVKREGWPVEALALLWRPVGSEWQVKPGQHPGLDTAKVYREIGWAVFVDQLPNPSVICGFKCGDLGANHTQLDNNVCNLWAYGRWLAIDLGSGSYTREYFSPKRWSLYEVKTLGHNSVMIAGKGQKPKTKGRLGPLQTGDGYALVTGDATANYADPNVKTARRTLLFLGTGGIVVIDEVRTAQPADISVCWHSWNQPAVRDGGATLSSGDVRLDITSWAAGKLTWQARHDVGKERKSRNVKPDWLLGVAAEPARSHLIVTHLYPRRKDTRAAEPLRVRRKNDQLVIDMGGAQWILGLADSSGGKGHAPQDFGPFFRVLGVGPVQP